MALMCDFTWEVFKGGEVFLVISWTVREKG